MTLDLFWYFVIILSILAYAVLDGFDLGVGLLHLLTKKDEHRRTFLNAIGPVWDGNEVWLVIVIGALFAGFPAVYATILSAFYLPVMILLMGLILRAVSIEFRSKREGASWRRNWDFLFAFGSLVIGFGVGVVLGNLMEGLPLDENYVFQGTFWSLFTFSSILIGLMTLSLFAMHGAIYLVMKTEGALHEMIRRKIPLAISVFIFFYLTATAVIIATKPHMVAPMLRYPLLFLVPAAAFASIFFVPILMKKKWDGWAFIVSCGSIALLLSLAAIGTFPYMIRSTIDPDRNSLTISNAASSTLTLKILAIIVAIGIPLVLAYGFYIYRTFRGKVEIDSSSY